MTVELARRFEHVVAVDVSPGMLARARARVAAAGAPNVTFHETDGRGLEVVPSESADVVVCYLVLQHLPSPALVRRHVAEFARVLKPAGEAFVQLPVLRPGGRARAWRLARAGLMPLTAALARHPAGGRAFRGTRLTEAELSAATAAAGLAVVARQTVESSDYRFSREVFLRLRR
jgi:ubiquinone/menaquinone biosynthesis C-methylase UbiE